MTRPRGIRALAAPLLGGAARVTAGVLWVFEGAEKLRAGFGASDILLVVDGAQANPRTPWWFEPVRAAMQVVPDAFGIGIPVLEVLLGLALIAGLLTRLTALASIATLALYWGSDQLIAQYPVMAMLSAVALAVPHSGRFGVGLLLNSRPRPAAEPE